MGFLTKKDHFGVFWGYHHLRKHPDIPTNFHNNNLARLGEVVEIGFSGRPWYCGFVALADLPGRWAVDLGMDEVVDGETAEMLASYASIVKKCCWYALKFAFLGLV